MLNIMSIKVAIDKSIHFFVGYQVACFQQMGLTPVSMFGRHLTAIEAEVTA
jgi:hypothetical protein